MLHPELKLLRQRSSYRLWEILNTVKIRKQKSIIYEIKLKRQLNNNAKFLEFLGSWILLFIRV